MKKIVEGTKVLLEKAILWVLRAFLTRYSIVIGKHFAERDAKFAGLRSDVITVAKDHWQHLNDLDARLKNLEAQNVRG